MVLAGIISLGKYTFESRLVLFISELLDSLKADENKVQGKVAVQLSNALGTSLGIFDFISNPKAHIAQIVSNGLSILHPIPITACLYRTSTSRQARK